MKKINEQNIRDGIGARLKKRRLEKGWTQAQLAEKVGLSDHFISVLECGEVNVSIHRLVQLSEVLDTDLIELVAEESIPEELSRKFMMLSEYNQRLITLIIDDMLILN